MAAAPPKKRKAAAPSFAEGDRVECFFRDWEQYFPATVSRMNDDLTYDVDYDDGYAEKNLPAKLLKPPKPGIWCLPHVMRQTLQTASLEYYK